MTVTPSQVDYWRKRGQRDAARDEAPLFRSTRAYGIVPELDDYPSDWTDEDIERLGRAYLAGYDSYNA